MKLTLSERQLATLASPRTNEVFETLVRHGKASAALLQESLGTNSKAIFYHLKKLSESGLVTSEVSDGTSIYRPASGEMVMPDGFQGDRYELLAAKAVELRLRRASRRFKDAALASRLDPSLIDDQLIIESRLNLRAAEKLEFRSRLKSLLAEFEKRSGTEPGNAVAFVAVSSRLTD